MDATTISVIIGTVCAAIGGLIGVLSTKGVSGWIKLREDKRIDQVREEKSANEVLMFTISRQDARIEKLESELRAVYDKHNDCERKYAALAVRLDGVDAAVRSSVQETKSAIRQAVHDAKDTANAAVLKLQADASESKKDHQ
jgi:alpha-beta hydrolase superfamily lysophospholipase